MNNSKLNKENGYEAIVFDAEDFLRISDMPLWRMYFETESLLIGYSARWPNAKRIAVFERPHFGSGNDDMDNKSMLRVMLSGKAKSLGWEVIVSKSGYWDGVGNAMSDPAVSSRSTLLVSSDRRSFGYLSDSVVVVYDGDGFPKKWTACDFRALYGLEPNLYWRFLALAGWSSDPSAWIDEGKALGKLEPADGQTSEEKLLDLFTGNSARANDLRARLAHVSPCLNHSDDLAVSKSGIGGGSER